jgi:hypothetical protein
LSIDSPIDTKPYSGGPHIRFPFWGEGPLWISGFGVLSRPNPSSGALKLTLPGPQEGASILNVDLVVVTTAVPVCAKYSPPKPFEFIESGAMAGTGPYNACCLYCLVTSIPPSYMNLLFLLCSWPRSFPRGEAGESPDSHFLLKIDGFGSVPARIRGG